MSSRRRVSMVAAFVFWVTGLYLLVEMGHVLGGALILLGGIVLVIAASGGWAHFWEGLVNWLCSWR